MKNFYTKSILSAPNKSEDGTRISVMSRHTLSDGITSDVRIVDGISYDEWCKELSPPAKLLGAYYRKEILWPEYEKRYLSYLRTESIKSLVRKLALRATNETITLLCIEESATNCHRRILAEELQITEPKLGVVHR